MTCIQTTALDSPIGYNITHDNGVVAMAFSSGDALYPDPPAYRIGIDVMLLQLPKRDTFSGFVEIFSEQVGPMMRLSFCILMFFHIAHGTGTWHTPPSCTVPTVGAQGATSPVLSHLDAQGSIHKSARAWDGV